MTRNNHLRNKKDFDLNKSFTEWQINRANEMKSTLLAKSDTVGFFLIDGQVFRALVNVDGTPKNGVDVYGHPMDARWECDHSRWQAFRSVFSWAEDVS